MENTPFGRREFLKSIGLGAAALTFPGWLTRCTQPETPPNVLFIAVDDLNDWVNCLGGRPGVQTPNLDRLASKGVLFTSAHCAAPACNPSRISIMTGMRPSTTGVYFNSHDWRDSPALEDQVPVPQHFRENNYRAVGGGKIFHCLSWIRTSYGWEANDPNIWDDYFPSKSRSLPEFVWPEGAQKDKLGTVTWTPLAGPETEGRPNWFFDWGPLSVSDKKTSDYKVVDWAIEELNKDHDRPFFQAVGLFRPHIPWFVPQEYFDLYPLDDVELPPVQENDLADCSPVGKGFCRRSWQRWILKQDKWREAVQAYLASISYMDAQLGRLLDAFKKSPTVDNTVIVLWSDHGMHIGEKEHWEKFTLWEESTRVPLIFVAPGITHSGGICHDPVSLLDVYPTLVELAGHAARPELEGTSLVPLLQNPKKETGRAVVTTFGQNNHGVRSRHWRYIRYHDGSEELYDHRIDPDEYHNLAGHLKYVEIKQELAQWLPEINRDPVDSVV